MRTGKYYIHSSKRFLAFILFISLLTNALGAAAQTRRRAPAPKKQAAAEENVDLTDFAAPDASRTMAAAFKTGALPPASAAILPEGTAEEQAAALAEMVAARDENSVPALLAALRAAGYGVRDARGNVSYNASGWQGISFDEWQIAAMAKLYGDDWGVGFGRFADSLSRIVPEFGRETNDAALLQDLRAASASDNAPVRFWANFIIELGRRGSAAYDLRSDDDARRARLDIIQTTLILSRFGADLTVLARRATPARAGVEDFRQPPNDGAAVFVNASSNVARATRNAVFKPEAEKIQNRSQQDAPPLPCGLGETESVILDYTATGLTTVFGQSIGILEENGRITKTPGQLLGAANAFLIMMKLVATYAALDSEIALDGGMLTRTKKATEDGERKSLTATIKIDTGRWQIMNCIRPALNLGGVDFSLPGSGALAGSRVDWRLVEGGEAATSVGRVWNTVKNMPAILDGKTVESNRIVWLDTTSTAKPEDKGKPYNYTDENGVSKIFAVGAAQKKDLTSEAVRPVIKRMAVELGIQVKTMKLKTGVAAAGTAGDLSGNAIGFLSGDIPGGIVGTAAETIYRAPAGTSKTFVFPVKDWIPCDGRWRGTLTLSRVIFNSSKTERRKEGKATRFWLTTDRDLYSVKINLEPGAARNRFRAAAQVFYGRKTYDYYRLDSFADCQSRRPPYSNVSTRLQTTSAAVGLILTEEDTLISIIGETALLKADIPDISGIYEELRSATVTGGCTPKPPTSSTDKKETRIDGGDAGLSDIPYDPKNPNVLRGTRTIPGQPGQQLVVSWDLSRCQ